MLFKCRSTMLLCDTVRGVCSILVSSFKLWPAGTARDTFRKTKSPSWRQKTQIYVDVYTSFCLFRTLILHGQTQAATDEGRLNRQITNAGIVLKNRVKWLYTQERRETTSENRAPLEGSLTRRDPQPNVWVVQWESARSGVSAKARR